MPITTGLIWIDLKFKPISTKASLKYLKHNQIIKRTGIVYKKGNEINPECGKITTNAIANRLNKISFGFILLNYHGVYSKYKYKILDFKQVIYKAIVLH